MHAASLLMLFAALCAAPAQSGSFDVTFDALLDEMVRLATLAEVPRPAFICRQFSSYDRASKSPSEDWFANNDAGQYLRVEERAGRKEHVMMDAAGPGAIVRIWSANPKGTLRVYIDGAEQPALEAPLADFLGGKSAGVPAPVACETSRGWNSYLPIPYAKSCRVTSDEGGFYYHVNYRTYAAGSRVESFGKETIAKSRERIERIAEELKHPAAIAVTPSGRELTRLSAEPAAGETSRLAEFKEGGSISALSLRVQADDLTTALRRCVLEMRFDGELTVACPLGDFFGSAPGVNEFQSRPLAVRPDKRGDRLVAAQVSSYWVMPFERAATIDVVNHSAAKVELQGSLIKYPRGGDAPPWTERNMHFHAKWRPAYGVPTRPMQDWNYMTAKGTGVFVGASFSIANPVKEWWGEGDEKIYVDGETFPSHFGTGTEDYYGYAWCCNVPFQHAYHNQPRCDGPGNYGHTSVNRWHILDKIPFERDFRFDMELWHWHETCKVDMSVVCYWYARPGGSDNFPPIDPTALHVPEVPPYQPPRVAGAIEGEEMRIVSKTAVAGPQDIGPCSNEKHLWWRDRPQPGEKLVLAFSVSEAGRRRVMARFMKAVDYGVVRIAINGKEALARLDLYNDGIKLSDEVDLGVHELRSGENELIVEIVGANEKAKKEYMFGLDYVRLAAP
ncbi:MAG: hypothetical protein CHACPFDD_02731 [Phycisphaerae bacterium]|nr:hypothetical protein [Phycisphaerae bacterium]